MADRFDELMRQTAQAANECVDYAKLKEAVVQKQRAQLKRRKTLVSSLSAAAVFLILLGVGAVFAGRGLLPKGANDAMSEAAVTSAQEEIYEEATAVADEPMVATVFDAEVMEEAAPAAEEAPVEAAEAPMEPRTDSGAGQAFEVDGDIDPQEAAALLLATSSGRFYDVGAANYDSCNCISGEAAETIGETTYFTVQGTVPLEVGQAYINGGGNEQGAVRSRGLWRSAEGEYVYIESGLSPEQLAETLMSMAGE